MITKHSVITAQDILPSVGDGIYDCSDSLFSDLGLNIEYIYEIRVGVKVLNINEIVINKAGKQIIINNNNLFNFNCMTLILKIKWRKIMAILPFIYGEVTLASITTSTNAVQKANGILNVFTLPAAAITAAPVDFTNFDMCAEINGVTFNAVSSLTGANPWDKVFTVSNTATGTVTLTFNYPPCQVIASVAFPNPYGQLEAVVDTSAPNTPLVSNVIVTYNGIG